MHLLLQIYPIIIRLLRRYGKINLKDYITSFIKRKKKL